ASTPKLPNDARALATAYREFALHATPRFDEAGASGSPGMVLAAAPGPFAKARSIFTRATIQARRRDPTLSPYLLVSSYYPNVYVGLRQAIAVDSLRFAIDRLDPRDRFAARKRDHYLAALLHALSVTTSATSHFCQPRGLTRDVEVKAVIARRAVSLAS